MVPVRFWVAKRFDSFFPLSNILLNQGVGDDLLFASFKKRGRHGLVGLDFLMELNLTFL